ncbi:hypothetical protein DOT_3693 [Desulfosporosinus sp. OT]|nr:hypothetical protein DOT_3693 [Desulfosporosinus sp. OT]
MDIVYAAWLIIYKGNPAQAGMQVGTVLACMLSEIPFPPMLPL